MKTLISDILGALEAFSWNSVLVSRGGFKLSRFSVLLEQIEFKLKNDQFVEFEIDVSSV